MTIGGLWIVLPPKDNELVVDEDLPAVQRDGHVSFILEVVCRLKALALEVFRGSRVYLSHRKGNDDWLLLYILILIYYDIPTSPPAGGGAS